MNRSQSFFFNAATASFAQQAALELAKWAKSNGMEIGVNGWWAGQQYPYNSLVTVWYDGPEDSLVKKAGQIASKYATERRR